MHGHTHTEKPAVVSHLRHLSHYLYGGRSFFDAYRWVAHPWSREPAAHRHGNRGWLPVIISDAAASFSLLLPTSPSPHSLRWSVLTVRSAVPLPLTSVHYSLPLPPCSLYPPLNLPQFLQHLSPCLLFCFQIFSNTRTHTLIHVCSTANIKICASWHDVFREERGNTHSLAEQRQCLIGSL